MNKILTILKNHKWAVVMAVLAGLILALPQFYFRFHESYQGIDMPLTGAETFYQGRIQEVRDGYPSMGNVWFLEYKDRSYIQPALGEIITSDLGKIFGLDMNNTILLSRIVFPALIFLAIYAFVYLLIKKKYVALLASAGILLADNVFTRPFILNLLKWEITEYQALGYARPINPQISSLLFFAFLVFFWLFLQTDTSKIKKWTFGILSGLFWGMSFYVYFYTWSLILVFLGILGLFFLFKKEWLDLRKIFFVVAVALIVAGPYILNTFQSMQYLEYTESSQRLGLVDGRQPLPINLVAATLIVFLIFFPRTLKKAYLFGATLFVSLLVVLNQQIITGKVLIGDHYHWYYSKPLAFIFMTIILFFLLEKIISSQILKKIIIGVIIAAFILNGFTTDAINYFYRLQNYSVDSDSIVGQQRYGPILDWLNANAQKDSVVLANSELSILISVYTPLNLALDPKWANQYLVPQRELLERLFLNYRLIGVSAQDATEVFFREKSWISMMIFSEYYRQTLGEWDQIPEEVILSLAKEYQVFSGYPIEKLFQKFKIKYAVWDTTKQPEWALGQYPFLREVRRDNKIIIFQVI